MPRPRTSFPHEGPSLIKGTFALYNALDNPDYEQKRRASREVGRIAYDCRKCRLVPTMNDTEERRVSCSANHKLNAKSTDGSARAIQVVRGVRFTICQKCTDYDDER